MFTHEKLEVYGFAIQFLRFVKESESQIPRGHADLADQLRRAAISIPPVTGDWVQERSRSRFREQGQVQGAGSGSRGRFRFRAGPGSETELRVKGRPGARAEGACRR